MKLRKKKSKDQTLHDAIRGSVPYGKLAGARIVLSDASAHSAMLGCTTYGTADVVERLALPRGSDYYSATVRSHETRHATYSKRMSVQMRKLTRFSEKLMYCAQIVEDCYVEQVALPSGLDYSALRAYCRDHVATAFADIADIKRHKQRCDKEPEAEFNCPQTRNGRILVAARALGMLKTYEGRAHPRMIGQAHDAIIKAIGGATYEVLPKIVNMARSEKRRLNAVRLLAALLESEEADMPDDPVLIPIVEGHGKGASCRIVDLNPKSAWTSQEKKVTVASAPSGAIVRVQRYVAAIVSGDSNGLFARRYRRNPSGTVLIDASGSMHATTENLKKLCNIVPDATVAYYSGDDVSCGTLAIYAMKNKRYNGELPSDTLHGGNSIDMEALQWLQKQALPWTLISDLQFCGSSFGGEEIAHAIVERESALGKLTVIPSFKTAFDVFTSRNAKVKRPVSLPSVAEIKEESGE